MKIGIIVQARMGSQRLPGKVLLKVLGKTFLEYQLERLKQVNNAQQVIVATSIETSDNPIAELCNKLNIPTFRGSEHNVLSRYHEAAQTYNLDAIVRINGDCPLIDTKVVQDVIEFFLNSHDSYDYVSNILTPTFPTGMHTEVFSFQALHRALKEARAPEELEHVTPYIYRNPQSFRLFNIALPRDYSVWRVTLDYLEDQKVLEAIITNLYPLTPDFDMYDIVDFLQKNPSINQINSKISKKATV